MNISNLLLMRSKFYSDIESIHSDDQILPYDTFLCASDALADEDNNYYGIAVSAQNLKQFLSYLVGIHQLEPLFSGNNLLLNINGNINPEQSVYFEEFKSLTTINGIETFKFKPTEAVANFSLAFKNTSFKGEQDDFSPFGYNDSTSIDTKLSATRQEIKDFFRLNYRSKFLRGIATFNMPKAYDKSYIIELIDLNVNLVVAGIQYNDDGIHNYEALVLARR